MFNEGNLFCTSKPAETCNIKYYFTKKSARLADQLITMNEYQHIKIHNRQHISLSTILGTFWVLSTYDFRAELLEDIFWVLSTYDFRADCNEYYSL